MISQTAFSFADNLPVADTITAHGETLYVSQWADRLGMSEDTLRKRLAANWDPVLAVTAPKQVTNRSRSLRNLVPDGAPGSRTWYDLPFEDDDWAQAFVEAHPDGASMEEVGLVMGVEVSWICEMEQGAIAKLKELFRQVAAGSFHSLNGQLGFLGGRDNAAQLDLAAHMLVQLLRGRSKELDGLAEEFCTGEDEGGGEDEGEELARLVQEQAVDGESER